MKTEKKYGYQHLVGRFETFYETFVKAYEASAGGHVDRPSAGLERQLIVEHFLKAVLPPCLRISRGWIIDRSGARTNELDVILEMPFFFSLPPLLVEEPRLHLAESVVAVVEVQSSLKWQKISRKTEDVKRLQRYEGGKVVSRSLERLQQIPIFFVIYRCQINDFQTLEEKFKNSKAPNSRPDGILVLQVSQGSQYTARYIDHIDTQIQAKTGGAALEAFVARLSALYRRMLLALPDIEKLNLLWF